MRWLERIILGAALLAATAAVAAEAPRLGQIVSPADLAAWDISIAPDGVGLPPGRGTAAAGETIFSDKCAACHGEKGVGRPNDALTGGAGSLGAGKVAVKTVGSYWPYATTLFDYIRRGMPYDAPKSLSSDEIYALSAYILALNGIIGATDTLDAASLPKVTMPNRDGFMPFPRQPH